MDPTAVPADLSTHSAAAAPTDPRVLIPAKDLKALQQRSDAKGLLRLAGHLAIMTASGAALGVAWYRGPWWLAIPALPIYGFTLVAMFACLHESVHRTAFRSSRLSDAVAWFAGLLSFYNSTFYRHYHGWHHRFTQIPGKDPELDDPKPTGWWSYLVELSGVTWWIGKVKTYAILCAGRTGRFPYIPDKARAEVVRSVRLQVAVYLVAIAASIALRQPLFALFWLIPVAVGQPILRWLLLAEHTGCTRDDDPLTNTRTTYTWFPVRFLMWDMPYHAEHHRYPALPFHALAAAHARMRASLAHVASGGYASVHVALIRSFSHPAPET